MVTLPIFQGDRHQSPCYLKLHFKHSKTTKLLLCSFVESKTPKKEIVQIFLESGTHGGIWPKITWGVIELQLSPRYSQKPDMVRHHIEFLGVLGGQLS